MRRVELISDRSLIAAGLPGEVVDELTYPSIFRECPDLVYPALVRVHGDDPSDVYIVNYPDCEPFRLRMPQGSYVTYGRYFQWKAAGGCGRSFADAVRAVAGDAVIAVAPDLVLARHDALVATGPVAPVATREKTPVRVYSKACAEIEAQWNATRLADNERAAAFVAGLREGERLLAASGEAAVGFAPLDSALEAAGIDALLVTSPHNVELFTGLSSETAVQHGLSCVYRPGAADIAVLAEVPFDRGDFRPAGFHDIAGALPDAVKTGVEEGHIGIGLVNDLRARRLAVVNAVAHLRRWQEERAITDVSYFIVAGNAVLKGFERAKAWFAGQEEASEREIEAIFQQGVADFARSVGFAGRVRPYFSIVHSGERTLLPATAGDYPVRAADATIKFDMGVLVYDAAGCVRACSDIARTICGTPQLQAAHDALRAALVDILIPSMRPGMSGGEVHRLGVDALQRCETELRAANLMPEGVAFEGYVRDCGHILHRTTTATLFFLPGVSTRLTPKMLGCVEFVWPLGDSVLAVEDGYLVTDTDVIPFTE